MPHLEIIEILAIGLLAALVLGFVSHRLNLSPTRISAKAINKCGFRR